MNILGLSCFYHDSAACALRDGKIVAAAQEERFTRRKNTPDFPKNAINFCIQAEGAGILDVDYIAFYEKPYLKFARAVCNHLKAYPFSLKNFMDTMPRWLEDRLILPLVFKKEFGFEGKTLFVKHHLSHAASAFLVSPFEEAAILTADGVGEWATMTYGFGKANQVQVQREILFPDSLGLFYTAVTTYLGFPALEGEGIVMGLAGYGDPVYLDKLREIFTIKPDGSFRLDQKFFGFFNEGVRMYTPWFVKTFGAPRLPGEEIEKRHSDMAASLQKLTEEILIMMARHLHTETKMDQLCLAGGLFLNCVANHKILEETPFKKIFVQPAAGDSGGALGAAAYVYYDFLGNKRDYVMTDAALGPEFSSEQIKRILRREGVDFKEMEYPALVLYVAAKIARGEIIGWFQGKMEYGPRALGNRSILADSRNPGMKDLLNSRVKHRESFRPYAPLVLEEKAGDYFDLKDLSPFMLLAPPVKEEKKRLIPSATHVDGTARVQTVNRNVNPKLWQLIKTFEDITGIPIILNTSFNLKGEPIVCAPEDAIAGFLKSDMDCLVMENIVVEKMRHAG